MYYYKAFGINICSDIELIQIPQTDIIEPQVWIKKRRVPKLLEGEVTDYQWIQIKRDEVLFGVENVASYYIQNGNYITVEVSENILPEDINLVQMYLMGTAMGAILVQRGRIPLHGSCIWKEGKTVLFTGVSGAGKSTTASYFLKQGWNLLSDDVTPICLKEDKVLVQSSFPQQKLWDDAVKRHKRESDKAKLLIKEEKRQKYAMDSDTDFHDKEEDLQTVIQLICKEQENVSYKEVKGIEKAILLREHTYRNFLYADNQAKQNHFQQCAKIAEKLKVYQVCRPIGKGTERQVYEIINRILEEEYGE